MTALPLGEAWRRLVATANRRQLSSPPVRVDMQGAPDARQRFSWTAALSALGAEVCHRTSGDARELAALRQLYDRIIDQRGVWQIPVNRVEHVMIGYTLLYLEEMTGESRYGRAAACLVEMLNDYPRAADGSLPYLPHTQLVLVDTLAMLCPFLARYATMHHVATLLDLATAQLRTFVAHNVDAETSLPYHGYYADGPRYLGLHGWGRGTGWYLLGLIDTLVELPASHSAHADLAAVFARAAETVRDCQRQDGHWHWAILHRADHTDSSTTSLIGYSLMRAIQAGILDDGFLPTVTRAVQALVGVTRIDGMLDGALGESRGLGKYPQQYGPRPWLQGSATALGALYLQETRMT
ncbi:MAG: glycoside hydrolase family 88 protein [Anaerolineae bacterium]|nr:glycoside hydrolase family 88 protein [Anaerolineae bacterium]